LAGYKPAESRLQPKLAALPGLLKQLLMESKAARFSWAELAGVLAAYLLIVLVLCPGNSLIGFPVQRDDFSLLSWDWSSLRMLWAKGWPPRPVSELVWTALSRAGLPAYYLALQALVVLYAFLALTVLRKLLGARPMGILFGILVAAAALSLECVVEYSKYTGLITSLLSGVFALAAMALMAGEGERLRAPVMVAVWGLAALSFWSKEDFILPTILLASYFAWEARGTARGNRWFALAAGVLLLAALLALYNRSGHSPFTEGSTGTYKRDLSPLSIYRTGVLYLFMSPVATLATALQASMLIWNLIGPAPVRWMRLALVQVLILLLLLPYCALPQHTAFYYVFNWVVWQIGAALILLWSVSGRAAVRWAVAAIAVLCIATGQPGRRNIAQWYRNAEQVNRNVLATLTKNADAMRPFQTVVIEGAPFLSPFESDGRFLSMRYGLDHDWMVRVPRDSDTYRTTEQLRAQTLGRVRTVAMEEVPRPAGAPVLRLSADGTGVLDLPSSQVRVDRVHPGSTAAGVGFQIQPNGQSAIAVEGAHFQPGAIVLFNGRDLKTTYGNPGFLSALVPDESIAQEGTIKVRVRNANGDASNEIEFHVRAKP